jgi:hypothetical protein
MDGKGVKTRRGEMDVKGVKTRMERGNRWPRSED